MSSVSIKIPPFSESSPSTWFIILEAQFHISSISVSQTKFFHALSGLPILVVSRLSPEILRNQNYEELKSAVEKYYDATKPELFDSLLKETELVGRPSNFLAEIRKIGQKVGVGDDLIRHKFQSALPPLMRPIIATQSSIGLDDLGSLADELLPLCSTCPTVNAVGHSRNDITKTSHHQNHSNNYRQHMGLKPFGSSQRQKVCRAHIFYGPKANSCRPWCLWPDKTGVTIKPVSNQASRESSPNPLNRHSNQ